MTQLDINQTLTFGPFTFFPTQDRLIHRDKSTESEHDVRLEPQISQLLHLLIQHQGNILSREAIMTAIWQNRHVSDDALRAVVKKLRAALNDNARAPQYIKTLPMKGYVFIATVTLGSSEPSLVEPNGDAQSETDDSTNATQAKTTTAAIVTQHAASVSPSVRLPIKTLLLALLLIIALLASLNWLSSEAIRQVISTPETVNTDAELSQPDIEQLTDMPGSEVNPDYNPHFQLLVFSHRTDSTAPLQLYFKHLRTGRIQRVTWDDYHYTNPLWSADGRRLLFSRSRQQLSSIEHLISEFDPQQGITQTQIIPITITAGRYVLGWGADNQTIYLKRDGSSPMNKGIEQLNLTTQALTRITAPDVAGPGDFFARTSPSGELLAILRAVNRTRTELLVLNLQDGRLITHQVMPAGVARLAWQADSQRIVTSGFNGNMYDVAVASGQITPVQLAHSNVNHVFYDCRHLAAKPNCFLLRQHNGNYLDILERPNPLAPATSPMRPGTVSNIMAGDHLSLAGADDFPVYNQTADTLYFVSRQNKQQHLYRYRPPHQPEAIFTLNPAQTVHSLQLSPDESKATAMIDKRVAVIDISAQTQVFLTSDVEQANNPVWSTQQPDTVIYSLKQGDKSALFSHVAGESRQRLHDSFIAIRQSQTHHIALDSSLTLWQLKPSGWQQLTTTGSTGNPTAIKIPSANPNRWQLAGNAVYYVRRQHRTAVAGRIDIISGEIEEKALENNRFRLNFDISQDEKKWLEVKSLVAQSNVIRASW